MENQNISKETSAGEKQKKSWMKWLDWLKSWIFVLVVATGCVMWRHNIFGIATNETVLLINRIMLQLLVPAGIILFVYGVLSYRTKKKAEPDSEITRFKKEILCCGDGLALVVCRFFFASLDNAISFVTIYCQVCGMCVFYLGLSSSMETKKILKDNILLILSGALLFLLPFLLRILGIW